MHNLPSVWFQNCLGISKSFQILSECTFTILVFKIFSAVPNRFKLHQSTCFRDIVFIFFSAVQNRFKYCQNVQVQRPICNKFILNTERKFFNYLWLNFVVESLHYFFLANIAKYKIVFFETSLKCPKIQLWQYRIS